MSNDNNLDEALSLNRELITMIRDVVKDLQTFQSNQQSIQQIIIDRFEAFETSARNEIREMREEIQRLKLGKG